MVYMQQNQLRRYHNLPDHYLTTHSHFYDGVSSVEAPDPDRRETLHKKSTFATLFKGSPTQRSLATPNSTQKATNNTLKLFPEPSHHTRTVPTSTYRGNGTFTVEFPHSNLTYKGLRLVPYGQLSWKSEYGGNFTNKTTHAYKGYSILSKRR
uniref:Uncharacterized protein n=1 Tax=Chlamydomonas leiostraca TaxID=1034604 RepID=A0A7S0RM46_9CHLO|mmetsp:Transcript_26550/g.67587  ORF Transcript_26550/g.67587 Transcript_26550/m.67587 type:complete len:152 (+) Transcript_26550:66-521(+)